MSVAAVRQPDLGLTTDRQRWDAVLRRNRAADGRFFYSVRTTGVYCRPSCPSRRPRRENVRFHATAADAEREGFRPCRRCRPAAISTADPHAAAIGRAIRLIEESETPPALEALADAAGLSRFHFHRVFRAATGMTPRAFAEAHRATRVRQTLVESATVTEAIYGAGFNSSGRFYSQASEVLGMTPAAYRAGGAGATVRFAVGRCRLGSVLVAATTRGVCAISLGGDPDALVRDLQDRFPHATLTAGDPSFDRLVATVIAFVEAPADGLSLPLHVRGTAFQHRVWQALRRIPAGTTVSYSELARCVGQPGAVRAVARACASNPVAVAIPCHRVVRVNGEVSGYRWGVERKRALLEAEAVTTAAATAR
ncbi:MAG TPA: bifunctional DNA-binding transcriptional regulator/O6-methylguanine-DNA methyltransferase Ada [Vicinamibacterales bacterium]|nr:bifunctional DNA-binding transcriptional regulator/O6-methylguanine-DNA methyltransferase Ada [Vicinamibacterales bacterium]